MNCIHVCTIPLPRYDSVENKRVRAELFRELRSQEEVYGKSMVERRLNMYLQMFVYIMCKRYIPSGVGAVSRLFENIKRNWKEGQSCMADKVERDSKNRKMAARRRRVYNAIFMQWIYCAHLIIARVFYCLQSYKRRSKYIANAEEREKWQQIDNRTMSDESFDEEGGLSVHRPTWRSSGK